MKAIVLEGIKQPLLLKEIAIPILNSGEALVRLHAAAFNRRDWWIRQGQYAGLKFPIVLGSDGAGIVEQVKDSAHKHWINRSVVINPAIGWGDSEVYQSEKFQILGLPEDGTLAEYVRVPVSNLHEMPAHLSFEEAAALPLGGLTAYRALFARAQLQPGERVLVVGTGGGAATFVLQWAVQTGAQVWVTSGSASKVSRAVALGAQGGVLYTDQHWVQQLKSEAGGFDVIVDSALGEAFADHLELANRGGRIVFFGGTVGDLPALNARKIFWKQLSILGTTMGSPEDFTQMLDFVGRHSIKPIIDSIHSFADAETALQKMNDSTRFGKVVLRIDT